jgi:hypothetical protein
MFLGFVGPHWEQQIVAELDSSLNEWIDTVPGHREYFLLSDSTELLNHFGQSNGIQLVRISRTSHVSFSPQAYTASTTTSKSWCIGRLYPHLENHRPCRSHRSRFAPTRLARAHTWWICSAAVPHSTPLLISRHESPPFFVKFSNYG